MSKTISLRQFSERNNKRILNKSNKLTLLPSASLPALAACGEATVLIATPPPPPARCNNAYRGVYGDF